MLTVQPPPPAIVAIRSDPQFVEGGSVATVDPAHDGNVAGIERARRDGLAARHVAATAGGWALPFRSGSFDAVIHADVLC